MSTEDSALRTRIDIMRPVVIVAAVGALLLGSALPAAAQVDSFLGRSSAQWIRELGSSKPAERRSAAFALGRLGLAGWNGVVLLRERLEKDDDAGVREMAATAIGDINAVKLAVDHEILPEDFIVSLCQALDKDASPRVRRSGAYALGCFGRLGSSRDEAIQGAFRKTIASLHKGAGDEDSTVRQNVAWALGQLGDLPDEEVATLTKLLEDKQVLVRRDAASALKSVGKKDNSVVKPLLAMVGSEKDDVVRRTALDALGSLAGPQHRDLPTDGFERLLLDSNPDTQRAAAMVLARIGGPKAAAAVAALRKALADPDPTTQGLAAAALAGLGPEAGPAVKDLAHVLKTSTNPTTREYAAIALGGLTGAEARLAVPALADALGAKELGVRRQATEALGHFQYPTNEEAVPALLDTIDKDTDERTRQHAIWALLNLRELNPKARTILTKVLDERAPDQIMVRYNAARLLAYVLRDKAPDRAVDVLLDMLQNTRLQIFEKVDASVTGAGTETNKASAGTEEKLGGDARFLAAEALACMGKLAAGNRAVVNALREAAKDKDKMLRENAKTALTKLGIP
jgi:HEAT repeat protein